MVFCTRLNEQAGVTLRCLTNTSMYIAVRDGFKTVCCSHFLLPMKLNEMVKGQL